jgi:hypothetical protein
MSKGAVYWRETPSGNSCTICKFAENVPNQLMRLGAGNPFQTEMVFFDVFGKNFFPIDKSSKKFSSGLVSPAALIYFYSARDSVKLAWFKPCAECLGQKHADLLRPKYAD